MCTFKKINWGYLYIIEFGTSELRQIVLLQTQWCLMEELTPYEQTCQRKFLGAFCQTRVARAREFVWEEK